MSGPSGGDKFQAPDEYAGIQVNFCRNPTCVNFGVPPPQQAANRGPGAQNAYIRTSSGKLDTVIRCSRCRSTTSLKSNRGVFEELVRIDPPLQGSKRASSCPTPGCPNFGEPAPDSSRYQSHGRTRSGKPRFECRACKRTFSSKALTRRSLYSVNEQWIFRHLVNKVPFRRICELNRLYPHTLYRKIDLIHRKCLAFCADHERKLPHMKFRRLYLSTDRQMFVVNWSSRRDRTNTLLAAIATADNISRYVFGSHLNFDPAVDANAAEADAIASGELNMFPYLRQSARLILNADMRLIAKRETRKRQNQRRRKKASPAIQIISRPPDYGAQVSDAYLMHAHFEFLRRRLAGSTSFRFYLDPDDGLRQACLTMFHREIAADRVEAFVVRIDKNMTRPQREKAIAQAWGVFEEHLVEINERLALGDTLEQLRTTGVSQIITEWEADLVHPSAEDVAEVFKRRQAMTKRDRRKAAQDPQAREVEAFVRRAMIRARMKRLRANKKGEFWLEHPMPRLDEPQKQVWRLTDRGTASGITDEQVAHLYDRASLHAIDNYFQLARRNFSSLERSPNTARRGRLHYIYMPFDPMTVARLLDIHRTHFNFVKAGQDGKTPAMRLGLVDRPFTEEEIVRFTEPVPPFPTTKPVRKRKAPASPAPTQTASAHATPPDPEVPF